jgi:hypothetical protein
MAGNPKGYDDVMRQLKDMPTTLAYGLRTGLEEAAVWVQAEAKKRCPRSPSQAEIDDAMRRRSDAKDPARKAKKAEMRERDKAHKKAQTMKRKAREKARKDKNAFRDEMRKKYKKSQLKGR